MSAITTSTVGRADLPGPIPPEMVEGEYLLERHGATLADYERIANEDTRLDFFDGVLVMHSPANVKHEDTFWFLGMLLRGFVMPRGLGRVFGSRTPLSLAGDRRVEPDLLFVRTENLGRLRDVEFEGPADLVIEILSPATRDYDLGRKRAIYAEAGVPEYWMIDPAASRLLVDRPAGQRTTEMNSGRYDAAAIPGFWIDVAWLWQNPLPDPAECLKQIGH